MSNRTSGGKNMMLTILMLLLVCCGCRSVQPQSAISPSSSRNYSYQELHALRDNNRDVLLDVTVTQILDGIFHDSYQYIVADVKVQKAFYISQECRNKNLLNGESDLVLLIKLTEAEETCYSELREVLLSSDSLIVHAYETRFKHLVDENGSPISDALDELEISYSFHNSVYDEFIDQPPGVMVQSLSAGGLIPIVDGVVAGEAIQNVLPEPMFYRIDLDGAGNICTGDRIEDVYSFLEEYVKQTKLRP